jgi:hypothetical protein
MRPASLRCLTSVSGDLLAALLAGRRLRGNPYARRQWIRTAQRLAAGLPEAALARAERTDEAAIDGLLASECFAELVGSYRELIDEPAAAHTARLVDLARMALEQALVLDLDPGAALFELEEAEHGRDPAETLAKGVLARARRRSGPPPSVPIPPGPAAHPLDRRVCGAARNLRDATLAEHALHRSAERAATTAEAARKALALRRGTPAAGPARRPAPVAVGPAQASPSTEPRLRPAAFPRRPQGP